MDTEQSDKVSSYEIYEFDTKDNKFSRSIGSAHGRTGKDACLNYEEENDWSSHDGKILFAKPPVCR